MVKNNKGGSKTKSIARKYATQTAPTAASKIFTIDDDCALYAQVQKMLGGNRCEVICDDGIVRSCIIRGKFRGFNKGKNLVTRNTFVMVGLREFTVKAGQDHSTVLECDLINVYSDDEKMRLRAANKTIPWRLFPDSDAGVQIQQQLQKNMKQGSKPSLSSDSNKVVQNSNDAYMTDANDDFEFVDDDTYNLHADAKAMKQMPANNDNSVLMDTGEEIDINDI